MATKTKSQQLAELIRTRARCLRQQKGLTGMKLATKMGMAQAQISRLENGKQGYRSAVLSKLGIALGVPSFYFLMTEEEWAKYQG